MDKLYAALMTKTSGSDLSTDVGGRIYADEAPEGATYPYIVFFNIPRGPEHTFSEDFENYQIQFSVFSASRALTEVTTIYGHMKSLFDECALSIAGSAHIWMKRLGSPMTMAEHHTTPAGDIPVKHWAIEYEIMTQNN